jgi:hypothetical protein
MEKVVRRVRIGKHNVKKEENTIGNTKDLHYYLPIVSSFFTNSVFLFLLCVTNVYYLLTT